MSRSDDAPAAKKAVYVSRDPSDGRILRLVIAVLVGVVATVVTYVVLAPFFAPTHPPADLMRADNPLKYPTLLVACGVPTLTLLLLEARAKKRRRKRDFAHARVLKKP